MFDELSKAAYLQAGFQKWCAAMARGVLLTNIKPNISHRAAFLGGAMYGQQWSGPASPRLT